MRRVVILFAGLAAIMLVFAVYVGFSHSVRAWFSEPFQEPTEAAQEATLTAKHIEIALPAELALGDVQPLVALPYTDDFEGPWPGPWQESGDVLWDRVNCNSHSPTHSASASGDPACATYYDYQFSWLIYGPFDLSGATAAGVDYWLDLDTEIYLDYNYAVASPDGINYCGRGWSGNSGGWMTDFFDFADPGCPNLLGDPGVWFAFLFLSDSSITYSGAWVDDVNIWASGNGGVPNDNFSDAYVIPAKPYSNSQPTCGATTEPGEPDCGCSSIEDTVWYKYHETTTQPAVADTFGSNYDTQLLVYSGPDPATFGDLTCICCNDDTGGLQSECAFTAEAGTTYYFQIDGFAGDCGNLVFNLNPDVPGCWTGLPPLAAGADLAPPSPAKTGEDTGVREGTPPSAAGDEAIPGELIVKFSPSVSQSEGEAAVKLEGAILLRHLLVPGYALVGVPKGEEQEFIARLEANPKVELAEPNIIMRATMVPNDPLYPDQWHLPQIQMEQAWDVADGSGVVVAVIDTGVAYENYDVYAQAPDLAGTSFTPGCDFENNDYHANDDDGHGTHVTGTVAQTTNNSLGTAGVAYGATIMPVKVLDENGSGSVDNVADGIVWAADYGADVINLSLGGGSHPVEEAAINYALASGVVVVAASGNAFPPEPNLSCPACYPGVIAVGATDYAQNRAPYSNYGCDPGGSGHCLDVMAPGGDTSADLNSDGYPDGVLQQTFTGVGGTCIEPDPTGFSYCFWQGTSMASPHVAGAAALLLDNNPSLTVPQVGDCLRNTAKDLGPAGYDLEYGHGLIQVRDALDACGGGPELADVKVLEFWTDPPEVYAQVSEWVVVGAGELKHNNGPSSAMASAWWVINNPPEVNVRWLAQPGDECTLDGVTVPCDDPGDINDLHFEVPLPVSVTTEVFREFQLHCKEVGDFVLTLGNEEWPIGLIDPDPTNNYLETQLTVHCVDVDTVVRIAGPTRHWTVAEGGQTDVPLDALQVDPGVCTVTVDVGYDPAVVDATACLPDPDGHFGTALCNITISGTVSLTFVETTTPVSGDFRLADITFDAVGSSGDISPLDVTIHQFADCGGAELPVTDEDGDIEIGVLGDVDCDGDWDSVDAMFILQYVVHLREAAYQCPLPSPDPLPYLDLRSCDTQQDGDCDAVDAMFILQCVVHIPNPFCPGEG